jgi:hypothetical protein
MLRQPSPVPRLARALTLGLALTLAHFAVESAIHAVHHSLWEPAEAAACPIATASSHLAGTIIDPIGAEPPLLLRLELAANLQPAEPTLNVRRPDQGRAPPQVA